MTPGLQYFDISPEISSKTGVFPGDVPYQRAIGMDFKLGHHLLLSSVTTTLHLGAHADGPNHYDPSGQSIGERELHYYMGICQVIDASKTPLGARIGAEIIRPGQIQAPRLLFKTGSFPNPDSWNSDFNSLSPELVDLLAKAGVILVGIDTPSIDPEKSTALEAHHRVAAHGLAILEGLVLDKVPDGLYTLVALPLRLKDADASPVRAILFKDPAIFP
jgi:arylformamidase